MALVKWDSSLDVLVESMNSEHKRWIDLINKLYEVNQSEQSTAIERAFTAMADYTIEHFSHEEDYLKSIDYPLFDMHKNEHTIFLDKIREAQNAQRTRGEAVPESFFTFLGSWLIRHIQIVDVRYGEFTEKMKKAG